MSDPYSPHDASAFGAAGHGQPTPAPPPPAAYAPAPAQLGYGGMAPYGMVAPRQSTNAFAAVSLGLGIAALVGGMIVGIVAFILGIVGLRQIRADPDRYHGRGLAIGGMIVSAVVVAFWIGVVIVVWIID